MKVIGRLLFLLSLIGTSVANAQDLYAHKLLKIPSIKRSNYISEGAFFYGKMEERKNGRDEHNRHRVEVKSLRHFYSKEKREERVVIDFNYADSFPVIYGYVAKGSKKIYIDIFNSDLNSNIAGWGKGELLKDVSFFQIDGDNVSMELDFSNRPQVDVFYLDKPARLVLDVRENLNHP